MAKTKEEKELSVREAVFVAAYMVERNATKAAQAAGYTGPNVRIIASQVMDRPHVADAIRVAAEQITSKFNATAERVLEELALIGFSDLRHFAISDLGYIELTEDAPDPAFRAVRKIKRKMRVIPRKDKEPIIEYDTECELWDKVSALGKLGEYHKLFKENRADEAPQDDLTDDECQERIVGVLRLVARRKKAKAS